MEAILDISEPVHAQLMQHLLPPDPMSEQAAFIFAKVTSKAGGQMVFTAIDWLPIVLGNMGSASLYHLEVNDHTMAAIIKHAHDLKASVVEFHSHLGPAPAAFSDSDRAGLTELVPHVRWRLEQRPYLAVVVSESGFDALVWRTASKQPEYLTGIHVAGRLAHPTRRSLFDWGGFDE